LLRYVTASLEGDDLVPDDTEVPADAAAEEERAVPDGGAAGPGAPAGGQLDKVAVLEAQLEESFKRAQQTAERLKDTHDRLLRTAAEFDNFKKRAAKEKEDVQRFGIERLLKDFLPVMDNLERALDHAEQHDPAQVIEGVRLVQKLFETTLAKHGVAGFSAIGKPFDPTMHEALMQQESDEPAGTVVSEMAKGYKLNDRLIRPAAVVVAKPRTAGETPQRSSQNGEGGAHG
jgi:molecular chaperone GrpE